jgi:hypothetical protein
MPVPTDHIDATAHRKGRAVAYLELLPQAEAS